MKKNAQKPARRRPRAADAFANAAARIGAGTSSLPNGADYYMERMSNNYPLLLTLYRNHWISRRIVDGPAEDMLRSWPKLTCELSPSDIKKFDRTIDRTATQSKMLTTIKWARLFGGAGALIVIKGHEKILDEPLNLEDVRPGSYHGLIPFDRWSGITPGAEVSDDFEYPRNFGLPKFYTVRGEGGQSFNVHHSRILRFTGPEVPSPEFQAQSRWGISVLEVVYDELKKRDNASWSILNLMFRAQILGLRDPELKQKLSGLGMSQAASQAWAQQLEAQNELMSNQSLVVMGKDGAMESHQYTFSGLGEVYQQFQMDVSGAAEFPMTRLFGRTMTGLGQSNDGDERIYEEKTAGRQNTEIKPQTDVLFPVICMSEFGEVPEDLDYAFPSIRVLSEEEKSNLAKSNSDAVIAAFNAGIISPRMALKELQQSAPTTGIFTNITDEDVEKASDEPQGGGEMSFGAGGGDDPLREATEDDVQQLGDIVEKAKAGDEDRPNGQVIELGGLRVCVENAPGSVRSGIADDGKKWSTKFKHHYGYIEGYRGADGDSLDCFVGPYRGSKKVFVIHQNKLDGNYDEDKVMLGYLTAGSAKNAYFAHYDRPEAFYDSMEEMPLGAFKRSIVRTSQALDELLQLTGIDTEWQGESKSKATDADVQDLLRVVKARTGDGWITIKSHKTAEGEEGPEGKGTHIFVGPGGKVTKGPEKLEGKNIKNLAGGKKAPKPEPPKAAKQNPRDPEGAIAKALKSDHKVDPRYQKLYKNSLDTQFTYDTKVSLVKRYLDGESEGDFKSPDGWKATVLTQGDLPYLVVTPPDDPRSTPVNFYIYKDYLPPGTSLELQNKYQVYNNEEYAKLPQEEKVKLSAEVALDRFAKVNTAAFYNEQKALYEPESHEQEKIDAHRKSVEELVAKRKKKSAEKKAITEALKNPKESPQTPEERFAVIRRGISGKRVDKKTESELGAHITRVADVMEKSGFDHRLFSRPVVAINVMKPTPFNYGGFSGTAVGFYNSYNESIRCVAGPGAGGTIAHEYGHHVDYTYLGIYSIRPKVQVPNDKLRKELAHNIKLEYQEEINRLEMKAGKTLDGPRACNDAAQQYGTQAVRAYACTNPGEWFAESFKAYALGGVEKERLKRNCPKTYDALRRIAEGELFQ